MASRAEIRLAGASGVVGMVLVVLGGILAGEFEEPLERDPAVIVEFYRGTELAGLVLIGVLLETVGFLLVMGFLAVVADTVAGTPTTVRWTSRLVLTAAVVATVLAIIAVACLLAGMHRAEHGGMADDGYLVLSDLRFASYQLGILAWALLFLSAGAAMVWHRTYPPWLGWAGVVVGAAHLVAPVIDAATWDPITGLGGVWLLVTGLILLLRPERVIASARPAPPAA